VHCDNATVKIETRARYLNNVHLVLAFIRPFNLSKIDSSAAGDNVHVTTKAAIKEILID